jgi:membrane-associated phospholipid phosphatase
LPFTRWLYETLNQLERAGKMRDVFPSGHAAIALMVQFYYFRWFGRRGFWLLPLTCALLISTVYLGYHYAIDVIAGAGLAAFCLTISAASAQKLVGVRKPRRGGR